MARLAKLSGRLTAICFLATASVMAAAQYGPAPRQDIPAGQAKHAKQAQPANATRAEVLRAAACVAGRNAAAADALLATSPFSTEEREKAVELLRTAQRCLRLPNPVATSAMVFRGAIAETLYETRFAQVPAPRTPPAAAAAFLRAADLAGRDNAALLAAHFEIAHCAVSAQPDLVRVLLATEPSTDAERTALAALYPAFGSCVPAGTQLTVDPGGIRATLAESLYRWSVVQRDGAASPFAAPPAAAAAAPAG